MGGEEGGREGGEEVGIGITRIKVDVAISKL